MYIYRLVTVHTKIIYFNLGLSLQVTELVSYAAIMRCVYASGGRSESSVIPPKVYLLANNLPSR